MRKQTQHVVNKLLWICEKTTRCSHQILFLQKCKAHGVVPKGLQVRFPNFLEQRPKHRIFKDGMQMDVMRSALSEVYARKAKNELDLSHQRNILKESSKLSDKRIDFLLNWFRRIAKKKETRHFESLKRKFTELMRRKRAKKAEIEEKKRMVQKEKDMELLRKLLENEYQEKQIKDILKRHRRLRVPQVS